MAVVQTPFCDYAVAGWTVTARLGNTAAGDFAKITESGLYSVGPFITTSDQGTYLVQVNSVTLSTHGTSFTFTNFAGLSSFNLTLSAAGSTLLSNTKSNFTKEKDVQNALTRAANQSSS